MRRLPPIVHATLKAVPKSEIKDTLSLADSLFEIHGQQKLSVNAVSDDISSNFSVASLVEQNKLVESEIRDIR